MLREILEDLRRRKSDLEINCRKATVFSGGGGEKSGKFKQLRWQDVNVGDIIEVSKGEKIPADAVIISSSEPLGTCYLDTASLDGESNLKLRQAHRGIAKKLENGIDVLNVTLSIGPPVRELNVFAASIKTNDDDDVTELDLAQFLPRGAVVINTDWALAVVVATGHDTKQLLNALARPHRKHSNCDRTVNRVICVLLILLVLTSLTLAVIHVVGSTNSKHMYLGPQTNDAFIEFAASFLRFLIMFHNIIPVSLLATVQMVRLIQAHYIKKDGLIYSERYKKGAEVQNSQLNEMLGQVKYVFTDKTGTVTKNKLTFRKCSIGGQVFTPEENAESLRQILIRCHCARGQLLSTCSISCVQARDMFLAISLCHTVIPNSQDGHRILVGSPDEKAVLQGANRFGVVTFEDRNESSAIVMDCNGEVASYEVLQVLDYSSERKKMSVIVKNDQDIIMFTKGADSAIFPALREPVGRATLTNIKAFATSGLRTMCYAMKKLEEDEYHNWLNSWHEALHANVIRRSETNAAFNHMERDLQFLGITAVEDELQDDVQASMRLLLEADIFVWMLSGDRQENAVSIAKSSGLIEETTPILLLPDCDLDESRRICLEHVDRFGEMRLDRKRNDLALVVSGRSIGQCRDCPSIREAIMKLCLCSRTVVW